MTQKQQQMAIADPRFNDNKSQMALALGYEFDPMRGPLYANWHKGTENRTHDWFERYFNDLNAMHEAERVLTFEQWTQYLEFLIESSSGPTYRAVCHATASQRAEAFLKTLGKWK